MSLVFFDDAISHIARISRVLRQVKIAYLLDFALIFLFCTAAWQCGARGSWWQRQAKPHSVTSSQITPPPDLLVDRSLACSMAGYACMEMEITRGFGYPEFQVRESKPSRPLPDSHFDCRFAGASEESDDRCRRPWQGRRLPAHRKPHH